MAEPSRVAGQILTTTVHTVESHTAAIKQCIEDNLSSGSGPRSTRANMVLLEIERITKSLEELVLQADSCFQEAQTPHRVHDLDLAYPSDDDIPEDAYDPTTDALSYENTSDEFYDSDRSPKYGW